jgi:hypothetical protein
MAKRGTVEYSYERMVSYIEKDDFLYSSYFHQIDDQNTVRSLFNAYVKNDREQKQIYKKIKIKVK